MVDIPGETARVNGYIFHHNDSRGGSTFIPQPTYTKAIRIYETVFGEVKDWDSADDRELAAEADFGGRYELVFIESQPPTEDREMASTFRCEGEDFGWRIGKLQTIPSYSTSPEWADTKTLVLYPHKQFPFDPDNESDDDEVFLQWERKDIVHTPRGEHERIHRFRIIACESELEDDAYCLIWQNTPVNF